MTRFILYTFILNILAFSAQATDYYVCGNGSDSNDGLSHATAWRTSSKAHSVFSTLNGDDRILFCKGEEFTASGGNWDNRNSTRNNPLTISSYMPPGATDLPNPILNASGTGITFSNGGNAEHKEGFVVKDLALRGNGSGYGIFIYNDSDYISVINVEIYNFDIGIHMGGSNSPGSGSDGKNSDLKVQGVYIHDNGDQGFLGGGDNLLIENSAFVNNGFLRAVFNHNIYITWDDGTNGTVRNNWLYQSAMFGGQCSGVSLVVHGFIRDLIIEDNVIWEDPDAVDGGCWGIAVDHGYGGSKPEQFPGLRIRGNTVVNVGGKAIGCSVCQDAIIEDNTIVHLVSSEGQTAIDVPNKSESSVPTSAQTNNVTVRNNAVLYDSPWSGSGVSLGNGAGSNYTSAGNRIYYAPGSGMIAGCESYNGGDSITVSAGICQNSIPQSLLDDALAKTEIPENLASLESSTTDSSSVGSSEVFDSGSSSNASAIGLHHIGLLVILLGIKLGRVLFSSTVRAFGRRTVMEARM